MINTDQSAVERFERLLLLDADEIPPPRVVSPSRRRFSPWLSFLLGLGTSALVIQTAMNWTSPTPPSESQVPAAAVTTTVSSADSSADSSAFPAVIDSLSIRKALISGVVDADSMTAAYYMSLFIQNKGSEKQEAEMQIRLPEGAAVTRATLWINGVAEEAAFANAGTAEQAYNWVTKLNRDPLLIRQIDRNTISIKASPVMPGRDGMKIRIGITAPLQPGINGEVTGQLPQITKKNFHDGTLDVHLESKSAIGLNSPEARINRLGTENVIRLNRDSLGEQPLSLTAVRTFNADTFAARATHSADGGYIVAHVNRDAAEPYVSLTKSLSRPNCRIFDREDVASRLSQLWAHGEIEQLAASGNTNGAEILANVYRVVSSVSSAVVLERESDYQHYQMNRNMSAAVSYVPRANQAAAPTINYGNAPLLQGATNGTIGPQGSDATVINGINTAGTVRVNNLANLEAGLNAVAHVSGPAGSAGINWLVGSTRDANLFDGPGTTDHLALISLFLALPLAILNLAPSIWLLVRGIARLVKGQSGSARLLGLGTGWLALGLIVPLLSQALALCTAVILLRRKKAGRRGTSA